MAEITARTVPIHNYREPMILGCTYTWGRLFKKAGICKPSITENDASLVNMSFLDSH